MWANEGRRTNNPDDWIQYDDYKQRLEIPGECQEIHHNWTGLGNEYRKMDEFEKREDRLKRDEQREIEAVGKVMQAIIETTSQEIYRKYAIIIEVCTGAKHGGDYNAGRNLSKAQNNRNRQIQTETRSTTNNRSKRRAEGAGN